MQNQLTEANTEAVLTKHLWHQRYLKRSLRDIAQDYGKPITHMDVKRALQGIYPVGAKKRLAFGLPALVPAVPCSACGEVHSIDRACQMQVKVTKPRQPKQRDRYPRFYAWIFEGIPAKEWK